MTRPRGLIRRSPGSAQMPGCLWVSRPFAGWALAARPVRLSTVAWLIENNPLSGRMRSRAMRRCRSCLYITEFQPENRCSECGAAFEPTVEWSFTTDERLARAARARRSFDKALFVCMSFPLGLVAWLVCPNLGLPFGYYGQMNRIVAAMERIPDVDVVGVRGNYDITLEEFSVDLRIAGELGHAVYFSDVPYHDRVAAMKEWESSELPAIRNSECATLIYDYWAPAACGEYLRRLGGHTTCE